MVFEKNSLLKLKLVNFFSGMAQAVNAFRVLFLTTHGFSAVQVSLVMSMSAVVGAVAPTISGMIADKVRSKYIVFLFVTAGCAVITLFMPASARIEVFGIMLASAMIPIFTMFMMPNYSLIESASVTATLVHPGLEYSRIRILMSVGFTISNFLFTPITRAFGVDAVFYFGTAYYIVQLALSRIISRYEYVPADAIESRAPEKQEKGKAQKAPAPSRKLSLAPIFQNGYLALFLIGNIIYPVGPNANSFLSYLLTHVGADTALVGIATALRVTGEVIILLLMPKIRARISLPLIQAICGTLCAVELAMYMVCKSLFAVLAVFAFGGFVWALSVGSSVVYVRMMAPEGLENTTVSLWYALSQVCGLVFILVFGAAIDNFGLMTMYKIALVCELVWVVTYLGGYAYMKYVRRVPPVQEMFGFSKKRHEAA